MKWFYRHSYALRLQLERVSIRERYLLLITLFVLIVLAFQGALMLTGLNNNDDIIARIEQRKNQADKVHQLLLDYQKAINNPQLIGLQNDNNNLIAKIDQLKQSISEINEKLMSPERMIELLRGLLEKQSYLSMVQFDVLPVKKIESSNGNSSLFYQHGIHMTLEGRFEALTSYLNAIESSSDYQLFWDGLDIKTENFPTLIIEINVHTLSQDEEWLNV